MLAGTGDGWFDVIGRNCTNRDFETYHSVMILQYKLNVTACTLYRSVLK